MRDNLSRLLGLSIHERRPAARGRRNVPIKGGLCLFGATEGFERERATMKGVGRIGLRIEHALEAGEGFGWPLEGE